MKDYPSSLAFIFGHNMKEISDCLYVKVVLQFILQLLIGGRVKFRNTTGYLRFGLFPETETFDSFLSDTLWLQSITNVNVTEV